MSSNATLRVLAVHSIRSGFRRNFHRTSDSLTVTSGCWRVVSPGRGRNQSFVGEPFAHGFLSKTAWVGARSTMTAYLSYKYKRL